MTHLWAFQALSPNGHYQYLCAHCGLRVTLEVYNDLQDLGAGILCVRDPTQLELL
jgi:hypothetical protein